MEIYVVRDRKDQRFIGIFKAAGINELVDIIDGEIEYPRSFEAISFRWLQTWFNRNKGEEQHTYYGEWVSLTKPTDEYVEEFHKKE